MHKRSALAPSVIQIAGVMRREMIRIVESCRGGSGEGITTAGSHGEVCVRGGAGEGGAQ